MSEGSKVIFQVLYGLVNLYQKFGSDAILIIPNEFNFTMKGYIIWEKGCVSINPEYQKTFLNAISICKAQDVWNSNINSYNFFADSFSSYCKPLLKALAKLEPDSAKEIKKQFEWFVGEI